MTEVRPVFAPMAQLSATYTPSTRLPTSTIQMRSEKVNAVAICAPVDMVGAKKVMPSSTAATEKSDLRADWGTWSMGKSWSIFFSALPRVCGFSDMSDPPVFL